MKPVKIKFKTLLVVLIFASNNTYCQNSISGIILSYEQVPIQFAYVSVYPLSDSTYVIGEITNEDGTYSINNLKNEDYILTVQMLGYEDHTQQIIVSGRHQIKTIELQIQSTILNEIQVVAQQSTIESHLGKKVLRIGLDLSSTGSNALEALDNIPSITTTPKGQIQIRGNTDVVIYINGKETRRDPKTLKFISAESLEKIEVITNPSAKYDAEGVGGIINLVYKKDKSSNVKVELISNLGLLTNPRYLNPNGGINASVSKKRISLFINISSDYGKYTDFVDFKRTNFNKLDSLQYYENSTDQHGKGSVSNALVGVTFEPDSSSSIGFEINFDRWDLENTIQHRNVFDFRFSTDQEIAFQTNRGEVENELWMNLAYNKTFAKKKNLRISLTAGGEYESNFSSSEEIENSALHSSIQQFLRSSEEQEKQRYYNIKLDYESPFLNWGTIETGLKADLINYNIFQSIALQSENLIVPDNDFNMAMQKLGIYLIQRKRIKKLEYAIGARLEQFSSDAFQESDKKNFIQKYARLFPSVQLNYLINNKANTIGINYTRRINRPGFFDINPYVSYEDPLNLRTGNPALRPEIADLIEANYHKEWKSLTMDLTLYHRTTRDAIQSIAQSFDDNRTLSTTTNIGKERSLGIEAVLAYRPTKTIKTSSAFVLSQSEYDDQLNDIIFNRQTSWSLRLRQQFRLKKNWEIEVSETYRAPSFGIQEKRHAQYYIHVSLNKKFNNKRGTFTLSISDLFNTRVDVTSFQTSDFELEEKYKWQSRQLTMGLRYIIFDNKR